MRDIDRMNKNVIYIYTYRSDRVVKRRMAAGEVQALLMAQSAAARGSERSAGKVMTLFGTLTSRIIKRIKKRGRIIESR